MTVSARHAQAAAVAEAAWSRDNAVVAVTGASSSRLWYYNDNYGGHMSSVR